MSITARDINEFRQYLHHCTDAQVQGVYDKETTAAEFDEDRLIYAELCLAEAEKRNIIVN